jgi:hypothetical protein
MCRNVGGPSIGKLKRAETDRKMVVENAMNAYTLEACLTAERYLSEWMRTHPDDLGIQEVASMLGISKAAALERETSQAPVAERSRAVGSAR